MEELRTKNKSLHGAAHHIGFDCIHPQAAHGSPYHVHPYPSPVRLQHAFQNPSNSPNMFHPKGLSKTQMDGVRGQASQNDSPVLSRALCFTPRASPVPGRVSHLSEKFQDTLTLTSDTDALVAKIGAMFPTVSETHIRILLKKYYNREAVVISALQVEKHPITTPGPLTVSPSVSRLQKSAMGVYSALQLAKGVSGSSQITSSTGTPHGSPSLWRPASGASSYYGSPRSVDGTTPRPHHSPKMKLRYLKSFFPKAEETLILDVLAGKDNNVQKASEELLALGFTRKDTAVTKPKEKTPNLPPKKFVQIMKTQEEKDALKEKLQKKYNTIAPRVVSIALESVDFNEDRAEQILSVVLQEDVSSASAKVSKDKDIHSKALTEPTKSVSALASSGQCDPEVKSPTECPPVRSNNRRQKNWTDHMKPTVVLFSSLEKTYKSSLLISSSGPNSQLRKGPQDSLLLEDYLTWNGPNPELRSGSTVKASGPERRSSGQAHTLASGPNPALNNGPAGIAKGTMYQKINNKSIKMCI